MKKNIAKKMFLVLLGACLVSTLMVLPYTAALSSQVAKILTPPVIAAQLIQSLFLFSIAIFFGLKFAHQVGFGLPILEKIVKGEKYKNSLKSILGYSVGMGFLAALLITLLSLMFSQSFLKIEVSMPIWKPFLASFYGGIAEEVLLRLFLMTLFVWLSWKIKKTPQGKPTTIGIWVAIVLSTIIFGLGHLPITGSITVITPLIVVRALLLNGVGAVFAYVYQKRGLESAMISHFSCDIFYHVIFPSIVSFFL